MGWLYALLPIRCGRNEIRCLIICIDDNIGSSKTELRLCEHHLNRIVIPFVDGDFSAVIVVSYAQISVLFRKSKESNHA